jgi:hypothetical protein
VLAVGACCAPDDRLKRRYSGVCGVEGERGKVDPRFVVDALVTDLPLDSMV